MVNTCIIDNCSKRAYYNINTENNARYCKEHKTQEMIYIITNSSRCKYENCIRYALFNYSTELKPVFCKIHKKDEMVDKLNRRCMENGCNIRPQYNYISELHGIYCSNHKKDNMINIANRVCSETGCKKIPSFNMPEYNYGLYCYSHKKENMVDVVSKYCIESGCKTRPIFNYPNMKQGIYCYSHKKDNMVDVINKLCIEPKCNNRAAYNDKSSKYSIYCIEHKKDNMINTSVKQCIISDCKHAAFYNYLHEKNALYCNEHRKDNMINLLRKCKTELCTTYRNPKYNGYCLRCFVYLFPDKKNVRNYKTKERAVLDYIKNNIPSVDIIGDKIIFDGCSKRRPDIYMDFGYQVIIVEIDENQHDMYDTVCENKRLMEISKDIGHRPLICIRFNPDKYTSDNILYKSCWTINKFGVCSIKKDKKLEWEERLNTLIKHIEYYINNPIDKTLEVTNLFYNK